MIRITGTEQTRTLIGNIVKDLHSQSPKADYVDYRISTGNSTLLTDKNGDTFRNVSILHLKDVDAVIGNKTGNILIGKQPSMIQGEVFQKICNFLEMIQPKNLAKAKNLKTTLHESYEESKSILKPDFSEFTQKLDSDGTIIEKTIEGSDNMGSTESVEEYETL